MENYKITNRKNQIKYKSEYVYNYISDGLF